MEEDQFIVRVVTPVTLIIGHDEKGNEMGFYKSFNGEWYNLITEMKVTDRFVMQFIDQVTNIRFGDKEYTRLQWIDEGCPMELTRSATDEEAAAAIQAIEKD